MPRRTGPIRVPIAAALLAAVIGGATVAAPALGAAPNVWKKHMVQSPSTGKIERFWVGRPAGLKADGQYPVIYFLGGLLDDDDDWKSGLDPHLAKYDLIAVCPAVGGATWFMNSPRQPWMRWGDFLTEDLRGFIEANYPASAEKGQRGIAGISAGGHAAFYHAIKRPELYGSVSVLSGAMDLRGYIGSVGLDYWVGPRIGEATPLYAERSCVVLAGRVDESLPFDLFLDAGDKDGALPQMTALKGILDAKGATYRWFVGQGSHAWTYWKTRADDHLAWHAQAFARNRREGRYTEKAPLNAAKLEVLADPPDIAPSPEIVRRLRAPWGTQKDLRPLAVNGLPTQGGPLSRSDEKYAEVTVRAGLTDAQGHGPGTYVFRVTVVAEAPLPKEGTITLGGRLKNGRNLYLLPLPSVAMAVPAGEAGRRVELRARLALEFKPPDALRGGFLAAVQPFDAAGVPVGEPLLVKARPGTADAERWTVAPQAQVEWVLVLAGQTALPLAAIRDVRMDSEPPPPAP